MEEETKHAEENATKQTSRLKKRALAAGFLTAAFFASVTYLIWQMVESDRRDPSISRPDNGKFRRPADQIHCEQ